MSDSDDNLTQHNMYENENTILRGQSSFLNQRFKNFASSTHTSVLQNVNCGYGSNPRNIQPFTRRETSPMSLRSFSEFGHHHFEKSLYSRGRGCESIMNGRSQSPGSVGSMDSTTSAVYVAQIFKNMKFNKYDKRIIHEAYNKYFKNRERRRVGKRRKLKLFIKHNRRKSDDSGDEGSNSSISSDDNRSVRSAVPKECILRPHNRSNRAEIVNFRETLKRSDMYSNCTESLKSSSLKNMLNDSHYVKPSLQLTNNIIDSRKDCSAMNVQLQKQFDYCQTSIGTQRERFAKGFTLPSERFNNSVRNPTDKHKAHPNSEKKSQYTSRSHDSDSENDDVFPNQTVISINNSINRKRILENHDSTILSNEKKNKLSCDVPRANTDDTTFKKPEMPVRRPIKSKRNFLSGPITPKSKYPLLSFLSNSIHKDTENVTNSTRKVNDTITESNSIQTNVDNNNKKSIDSDSDDIFSPNTSMNSPKPLKLNIKDKNDNKISPENKAKRCRAANVNKSKNQKNLHVKSPQTKKKDITTTKESEEEILISKSKQPLTGNVEVINAASCQNSQPSKQTNTNKVSENTSDIPSLSDLSMKPSFIKRKLFTQKLDIADDKNASVDSLATNSPHPTTYKLREKNKVRKLASSQSCLSRDIVGGENILDLIHKIVPANQMNLTSTTNQKARNNSQEDEDRWDVTSVISMCNKTNESDTFTDEDIFQVNDPKNNKIQKKLSSQNNKKQRVEQINVQNIMREEPVNKQEPIKKIEYTANNVTSNTTKRTITRRINAYWDTDFETDLEDNNIRLPAKKIGQSNENEVRNTENIQKTILAEAVKSNNLKGNCSVILYKRPEDTLKSENKLAKLSEKKDESVKNGSSPKKDNKPAEV